MTLQDASEPGSNGQFAVSLSEAASTDTVIAYTVGGTATAGVDFTALSGTVTIPAGQIFATLDVEVLDDTDIEDPESVIVTLDTVTAGDANIAIGADNTATVAIGDDDLPPAFPIASIAAVQDAAEPSSNGQFAVSLSEVADTDTTISYAISGTATSGEDFTALPGTITIPAGSLSAPIDVLVLDDLEIEVEENITLTLDTITAGDADILIGASDVATIAISDDDGASATVLYRINAGGPEIAALDGGPNFLADTVANNSEFLLNPGSNRTASFPAVEPGPTVDPSVPGAIFNTERFDFAAAPNLQYAFDVPTAGTYEVRLFLGNGFNGTSAPGQRVFDVAIEGSVPDNLNDVDLAAQFGHLIGGVVSNTVDVTDGTLNIEFFHGTQNPLVNGIEIVQLS